MREFNRYFYLQLIDLSLYHFRFIMNRNLYILILLTFAFKTFGQLTIDHATGRGSATIPIHTVSEGKLAIPITLYYDASGIQVGANSSQVGLNWSLNTVGQITRVVRDLPDEGWAQFRINNGPVVSEWNYLTNADAPLLVPDKKWAAFRDCEPDLFILSLNGQTYQFYMGPGPETTSTVLKPKVVLVKQEQDISIEPIVAASKATPYTGQPSYTLHELLTKNGEIMGLLGFKVTDTNGVVYYFGESAAEREYAFSYDTYKRSNYLFHSYFNNINIALSTSAPYAWKISRMVLPKVASTNTDNYQEIKFTYQRTRTVKLPLPPLLERDYTIGYNELASNQGNLPDSLPPRNGSDTLQTGAAPQAIAAGCNPVPRLKACGQGPYSCVLTTDRLIQLEATLVKIEGASFAIDLNASSLLMGPEPANIGAIVVDYQTGSFSSTQDRSVLESNQLAFGESTILADNRPSPILALPSTPLLRNILITDKKSNKQLGYYLDYEYYNYYLNQTQNRGLYETPYAQLQLKGVYPLLIESGSLQLDNGYSFTYNGSFLPDPANAARDAWGYANGQDDNLNKTGFISTPPPCEAPDSDLSPNLTFAQLGSLKSIKLPTGGTSSFVYELHDGNYFEGFSEVYSNGTADTAGFRPIGGLRVKQIMTTDPLRQSTYKRNYTYKLSDSPTARSSGFLSVWPDQFSYFNSERIYYVVPSQYAFITNRFINGSYITYSRVKEEQIALVNSTETTNGYTLYDFTTSGERLPFISEGQYLVGGTAPRIGPCYSLFSYDGNLPTYSYLKGTPQAVRVYNKDGQLQQETFFTYTAVDKKAELGLKAGVKLPSMRINVDGNEIINSFSQAYAGGLNPGFIAQSGALVSGFYLATIIVLSSFLGSGNPIDNTNYSKLKSYTTPAAVVYLAEKKDVSYSSDGTTSLATLTTYTYGSLTHHQPTAVITDYATTNNPDGNTTSKQEVRLVYNTDYNLTSSPTKNDELKGLDALAARKVLTPIETITIQNERVIGGTYTQYHGDHADASAFGLPKTSWALELESPVPVNSFPFTSVGSGEIAKSGAYKAQAIIQSYNARGLPTVSVDAHNPNVVTSTTYDNTGFLPVTSSVTTPGGKVYTTSYDYTTPLFGVSKVSNPDGSFASYEYDGLGRPKVTRDLTNNVVRSVTYTSVGTPTANDQITIRLQPGTLTGAGPIKQLVQGTVVSSAEIQTIKQPSTSGKVTIQAIPTAGASLVYDLKGPTVSSPSIPVNKQTTTKDLVTNYAFDERYGYGFVPVTGTYQLTVKAYSQEEGQGVLLSQKTIQFTIQ